MTMLQLGPNLDLPLQAATETFGLLGTRGAGKSNAAVVMAEAMWDAGLPWVAVDPKGDWWGLRAAGTGPGLPLPIIGGLHGDLPLEAGAGAFLADLVVDLNLTCVLDVSQLSKADRARLLVAFFDRLYRRHQADPTPRHLFLEEAHDYLPQTVMADDAKLKAAASRVVLFGRSFGLGATVASQRSARLHKDVLTQVGTLLAMRTLAATDRAAIKGWVTEHDVAPDLLASLSTLQPGEAWLWSPSWLGRVERVSFRQRRTFDSGATPVVGGKARPPATLADVDLAAVKEAMADTIAKAEAADPKRLRDRVTALERALDAARAALVPAVDPALVALLRSNLDGVGDNLDQAQLAIDATREALHIARSAVRTAETSPPSPVQPLTTKARIRPVPGPVPAEPAQVVMVLPVATITGLPPGPHVRAVFTALAQNPAGLNRIQLALLSRYKVKSSSLDNAVGALRSAGLAGRGSTPYTLTEAGFALAASANLEALPTGRALYDYWMGRLDQKSERAVLRVLVDVWPAEAARSFLAAETGYSPTSSTLDNALGRLRSLQLAAGYKASDDFMKAINQ